MGRASTLTKPDPRGAKAPVTPRARRAKATFLPRRKRTIIAIRALTASTRIRTENTHARLATRPGSALRASTSRWFLLRPTPVARPARAAGIGLPATTYTPHAQHTAAIVRVENTTHRAPQQRTGRAKTAAAKRNTSMAATKARAKRAPRARTLTAALNPRAHTARV